MENYGIFKNLSSENADLIFFISKFKNTYRIRAHQKPQNQSLSRKEVLLKF